MKTKKKEKKPIIWYRDFSKAVIYGALNISSGFYYIGQTVNNPILRWRVHISGRGRCCQSLCEAITVTKETDWRFAVLEKVKFPSDVTSYDDRAYYLNFRENEYIKLYDAVENGYNSRLEYVPEYFIRSSDYIKINKCDDFYPIEFWANGDLCPITVDAE